ncbi:MAG TPA: ABC transporter permease [Thermoplasmata archaeon]
MTPESAPGPAEKRPDPMEGLSSGLRKLMRGPGLTWKLYKGSKTGLMGLGIMLSFVIMAVFAPFISPYSAEFRAPAGDIFVADYESANMTDPLTWYAPVGLAKDVRERPLERILVYSQEGVARMFSVSIGAQEIVISDPIVLSIPQNVSYLQYLHFPRTASESTFFFVLQGSTLYEYTSSLIDANVEYSLPFAPSYHSNLWNGYSLQLNQGRMALAFADGEEVWLIVKRPRSSFDPFVRTFTSNISIPGETVIGNPLVVDTDYIENGSMLVVPTDQALTAFRLEVTKSNLTQTVTNVRIGAQVWRHNYTISDKQYEPIDSPDMMTYAFPEGSSDETGKTHVILATKDGRVVSIDRENGTVGYANPLVIPAVTSYDITGLYPSPLYVVATGTIPGRGLIVGLDPAFGVVAQNSSAYSLPDGMIDGKPAYVSGMWSYLYSTDANSIYVTNALMKTNATFSPLSGTMTTPVSFLGNIYISGSVTGNYFGVITDENKLFVETLSGVNKAPLPPGKYQSGNRYILGTDYEGHDILAWVIYGTRSELMVGITAAFFAVVIGTIVGLVAGFYSGLTDDLLMRATDIVLSLPGLVIILLFAAVFGPSLTNIIIIIAILSWAGIARVIRSVTLSLKQRSFVDAARIAGASDSRLIFRHIAPNVLPYTFLYMTFTISGAIVTEAILAFLGYGDVNNVTWGMMLQYLQISGHSLDAPWWLLPPGICITLLSLSFYLIGRAFDEVVNPRLRKR